MVAIGSWVSSLPPMLCKLVNWLSAGKNLRGEGANDNKPLFLKQ